MRPAGLAWVMRERRHATHVLEAVERARCAIGCAVGCRRWRRRDKRGVNRGWAMRYARCEHGHVHRTPSLQKYVKLALIRYNLKMSIFGLFGCLLDLYKVCHAGNVRAVAM